MAAKKTAAKKTTTRKAKAEEACYYCGREAVARLTDKGSAVCQTHRNRAESRGQDVKAL